MVLGFGTFGFAHWGLVHWVHREDNLRVLCKLLHNLLTIASVGLIHKTLFRKHIPSFVLVTYRSTPY